jgi:hypothetical protein
LLNVQHRGAQVIGRQGESLNTDEQHITVLRQQLA